MALNLNLSLQELVYIKYESNKLFEQAGPSKDFDICSTVSFLRPARLS